MTFPCIRLTAKQLSPKAHNHVVKHYDNTTEAASGWRKQPLHISSNRNGKSLFAWGAKATEGAIAMVHPGTH